MEAVILAGGLGKRLNGAAGDVPKPMAEINGTPFLEFLLARLAGAGAKKIVLAVGYKRKAIKDHFGNSFGQTDIEYSIETLPLGTGGALRKALGALSDENALVLNGDSFFDIDLSKMFDFHLKNGTMMTMALKPMMDFDRYGSVMVDGGRVTGFKEKAFVHSGYINAGVYAVNRRILGILEEYGPSFSLETDLLQKRGAKLGISAFVSDGYFIDIGIPEDYAKAKSELKAVFDVKGARKSG